MDADITKPETPRRRRWVKRVVVVALVLVAVGVFLYVLWSMRARSGLEAEIARLRAAGEPVTLEELWPPPIEPESENAALLYQQAADLFKKGEFEAFEKAVGTDVSWTDPGSWSEETVAAVRQMVEQCDEALVLVRRAAQMERCRFDPKWGWPPTTPMYHYAMLRQAARALWWSAALKLQDGDPDGALQEAHDAFLISRALAAERTLMSLLVRQGVLYIALEASQSVPGQHDARPDLLRAFLTDIEEARVALRTHLVDSYKGERVEALANLAPISGLDYLLPAASRRAAPPPPRTPLAWLGRSFGDKMVMGYLDTIPRVLEIGRVDYVDARPLIDALNADAAEWMRHGVRHYSRILVAMVVPAWVRVKQEETRAEAALAVAEVAFALKLYKGEHGDYPESLDALSPGTLQAVPADPFTGKPLVYVREGEGFLVQSLGLNGKDDGGLTETWKDGKKVNPGTDDIARRCSR
jgi:hypothetical protein